MKLPPHFPTVFCNWKRPLKNRLFRALDLRWKTKHGLPVDIGSLSDWITYNEIFVDQEYGEAIRRLFDDALPQRHYHVLDLGAHTGFFTLFLVEAWLRLNADQREKLSIIQVEASGESVRKLKARFSRNLGHPSLSITSWHGLAGRRSGVAYLRHGRHENMNRVESRQHSWKLSLRGSHESVAYVDLNSICSDWEVIDLLKVDIEGSEFNLIDHYHELLSKTQLAVIEFHSVSGSVDDAVKKLQAHGLSEIAVINDHGSTTTRLFNRSLP